MTPTHHPVTKSFHWIVAVAVIIQYISVLLLPEGESDPSTIVNFHMSFGVVILVLMLARLAWRLYAKTPPESAALPHWQIILSTWTHYALYALLTAMPLIGWAWASSLGWSVTLFGVLPLPSIVATNDSLAQTFGPLHSLVSLGIISIVGLHVAAALYHWLVVKDDVMQRMLP